MKAVFSLLFRPKILITLAFFGFLLFAFQNCQSGGSSFAGLKSTCVSDCTSTQGVPNDDLIKVDVADGGDGRLDIGKSDTTLTVYGSCSRGGYPYATVTAKLKRANGSAPNPTKTLTADCAGGSWTVTFTSMQDYSPNTNSNDLSLEVGIVSQDDNGDPAYPSIASNGHKTYVVGYLSGVPNPTPTPPPGSQQTLSIINTGASGKTLNIYAYLYPCSSNVPSSLTLTFQNLTKGTAAFTKTYSLIPINLSCLITVTIVPGSDDQSPNVTDATAQKYSISMSAGSYSDTGYIYTPPPAGSNPPYSISQGGSPYCFFTQAGLYQANSVALPVNFYNPTSTGSFSVTFDYRDLTLGNPWAQGTSQVSPASGLGQVVLNTTAQAPNPNTHLMLYRVYYTNSSNVKTILGMQSSSQGGSLTSNGNCP